MTFRDLIKPSLSALLYNRPEDSVTALTALSTACVLHGKRSYDISPSPFCLTNN